MAHEGLGAEQHAQHVDLEVGAGGGRLDVPQRFDRLEHARVVDPEVDRSEASLDRYREVGHGGGVPNVEPRADHVGPVREHGRRPGAEPEPEPARTEGGCEPRPEPAARAGDHRRAAAQVEIHGGEHILIAPPASADWRPFVRSLPRVLLIDLDDTIVRYGVGGEGLWAEVALRFAGRLPVVPERLLAAVDAVRETFWAEPERSRLARQDMFVARRVIVAQAFERIGLSPESELVREVADAYSSEKEAQVAPFPGALAALAELRRRGHVLGLLTNGGARLQRAKLERYDLARYFDVVRIEGEVGVGKPEPAAFAGALAALGASGEAALMIGDDLEADIAGGHAAGLETVWIDHRGTGPPPGAPLPRHAVRALAELLAWG